MFAPGTDEAARRGSTREAIGASSGSSSSSRRTSCIAALILILGYTILDRPGGLSYGSLLDPIRYWSIPRAAWRPSLIAHTTRDCPRRISPAAKTPGTDVI